MAHTFTCCDCSKDFEKPKNNHPLRCGPCAYLHITARKRSQARAWAQARARRKAEAREAHA